MLILFYFAAIKKIKEIFLNILFKLFNYCLRNYYACYIIIHKTMINVVKFTKYVKCVKW